MDNSVLQTELKRMMRAEGISLLVAGIRLHDSVSTAVDEVREEIVAEKDNYVYCSDCGSLLDTDRDEHYEVKGQIFCPACY